MALRRAAAWLCATRGARESEGELLEEGDQLVMIRASRGLPEDSQELIPDVDQGQGQLQEEQEEAGQEDQSQSGLKRRKDCRNL